MTKINKPETSRRRDLIGGSSSARAAAAVGDAAARATLRHHRGLQSARQIQGILRVAGEGLDREYLTDWSRRLGVADLLQRAFELELRRKNPAFPSARRVE